MDHFKRYKRHLAISTSFAIILPGVVGFAAFLVLFETAGLEAGPAAFISLVLFFITSAITITLITNFGSDPIHKVWQAIWHISPDKSNTPPPKLDEIKNPDTKILVGSIVGQIYDLASSKQLPVYNSDLSEPSPQLQSLATDNNRILETIPAAVFFLDKNWAVNYANQRAIEYSELSKEKVIGKSIYDVLHMSFRKSSDTLDGWLNSVKGNKATDSRIWEQVKLDIEGGKTKQFDLAVSYNQDDSYGNEAVLILFDRNRTYSAEDQATAYVAMAVHELRTPLTMLRGYIEMFEDELGPNLSEEHKEFMRKMHASAQGLSAFVSNILNVARIDENALVLKLQEADWKSTLNEIIDSLSLRAQVRNKRFTINIPDGLPTVAVDKISISEVITNLVENAIKYSGQSPDIIINVEVGQDGMIETTVEDHGVGIPESVIGGLFTKYYRSHRSKNAVGGTGLGLYLAKAIVNAHGGNVWVKSKEGEGSRFSFSLQPYERIKDQAAGQDGIERQASGWIKNHSLYRR